MVFQVDNTHNFLFSYLIFFMHRYFSVSQVNIVMQACIHYGGQEKETEIYFNWIYGKCNTTRISEFIVGLKNRAQSLIKSTGTGKILDRLVWTPDVYNIF